MLCLYGKVTVLNLLLFPYIAVIYSFHDVLFNLLFVSAYLLLTYNGYYWGSIPATHALKVAFAHRKLNKVFIMLVLIALVSGAVILSMYIHWWLFALFAVLNPLVTGVLLVSGAGSLGFSLGLTRTHPFTMGKYLHR